MTLAAETNIFKFLYVETRNNTIPLIALRYSRCANFPTATFSDDDHIFPFSIPFCGEQFTYRDTAVIPNKHINVAFGLHFRSRGRSAAADPVTSVLFTAIKAMDPTSE
jgi:hypothetical protein